MDMQALGVLLQQIGYLIGIFLFVWYLRNDSKTDYLKLEKQLEEARKETCLKIEEARRETNSMIATIHEEMVDFHNAMRDFHGRVCTLEERNRGK